MTDKPSDTPITDNIIPLGAALNGDIPHYVIELAGQCRNFERELKQITEAEMPEPMARISPESLDELQTKQMVFCHSPILNKHNARLIPLYGPDMKAYALRMADEADGQFKYAGRLLEQLHKAETEAREQRERAEEIQWRNIKHVVKTLADWAFESKNHPQYGSCWMAMVNGLTANDGPKFNLEPIRAESAEQANAALVAENEGLRKAAERYLHAIFMMADDGWLMHGVEGMSDAQKLVDEIAQEHPEIKKRIAAIDSAMKGGGE